MDDMEIRAECVYDWIVEIDLLIFTGFINGMKKIAISKEEINGWEKEFEQFMEVKKSLHNKTKGDESIKDVEQLIPNNKWLKLVLSVFNDERNLAKHLGSDILSAETAMETSKELDKRVESKKNRTEKN